MNRLFTPFIYCLMAIFFGFGLQAQTTQSQLHNQANLDYLASMSKKSTLTEPERAKIRETMLTIMNEARRNPNYRKLQKCKTALNLPSNLKPMFMDDKLNMLAQQQADYQASINKVTHANRNFKLSPGEDATNYYGYRARITQYPKAGPEACAGNMELAATPIEWMKSETHYRPTWNLDGDNSKGVGFGFAKGSDGFWYTTAVWGYFDESEATTSVHKKNLAAAPTGGTPAPPTASTVNSPAGSGMKQGDKLLEGQTLVSANGKYQLRGMPDGNFIIEDVKEGSVLYTFPLTSSVSNRPAVSYLSYQPDGNICVISKQNKGYYATNGRDAVAPVILGKSERALLTNDGRLALINKQGQEIWSTKPRHILVKRQYVVSVNDAYGKESQAHKLNLGDEMFFMESYKQQTPHRVLVQGYTYNVLAIGKGGDRSGGQALLHFHPENDRAAWTNALKNAGMLKVISLSNTPFHPYNSYSVSAEQATPNGPIKLLFELYDEVNGKQQGLVSSFTVETKPMKWPL